MLLELQEATVCTVVVPHPHVMQELSSLHGHLHAITSIGTAQAGAAASKLDWDRLQKTLATTIDKAMYVMVIAALPLCNKGDRLDPDDTCMCNSARPLDVVSTVTKRFSDVTHCMYDVTGLA